MLMISFIAYQGLAQQNDHVHVGSKSKISEDSLKLINQIWDREWNKWRDSCFGLDIQKDMKIGEVGAGSGEFAAVLSEKVGSEGFIYANDVELSKITKIEDLISLKNIENMMAILGDEDDALFPDKILDMAVMVEVYHHIDNPSIFFDNLKKYLVKNALVVIIDPDVNQPGGTLEGCYSDPKTTRSLLLKLGYDNISINHHKIVDLDLYILKAKLK
jgi:ubiquinone/menaquinone biosynthesis C-methylase UbiE